MSEHEANLYIAHLDAAIVTLEWLARNQTRIKTIVAPGVKISDPTSAGGNE